MIVASYTVLIVTCLNLATHVSYMTEVQSQYVFGQRSDTA